MRIVSRVRAEQTVQFQADRMELAGDVELHHRILPDAQSIVRLGEKLVLDIADFIVVKINGLKFSRCGSFERHGLTGIDGSDEKIALQQHPEKHDPEQYQSRFAHGTGGRATVSC